MRPGDRAKLFRARDPDEPPELPEVILIGFARIGVAQIGKPLDLWRYFGQFINLRRRQRPALPLDYRNVIHPPFLLPAHENTRDNPLYIGFPPKQTAFCRRENFLSK